MTKRTEPVLVASPEGELGRTIVQMGGPADRAVPLFLVVDESPDGSIQLWASGPTTQRNLVGEAEFSRREQAAGRIAAAGLIARERASELRKRGIVRRFGGLGE